jgi:hypothetical protein
MTQRTNGTTATGGVGPFRVSCNYVYWAHQPGADDGQPLAVEIMTLHDSVQPGRDFVLVPEGRPDLVHEIMDVAGLYVGGRDTDLRAARVLNRARVWLRAVGYRK